MCTQTTQTDNTKRRANIVPRSAHPSLLPLPSSCSWPCTCRHVYECLRGCVYTSFLALPLWAEPGPKFYRVVVWESTLPAMPRPLASPRRSATSPSLFSPSYVEQRSQITFHCHCRPAASGWDLGEIDVCHRGAVSRMCERRGDSIPVPNAVPTTGVHVISVSP